VTRLAVSTSSGSRLTERGERTGIYTQSRTAFLVSLGYYYDVIKLHHVESCFSESPVIPFAFFTVIRTVFRCYSFLSVWIVNIIDFFI